MKKQAFTLIELLVVIVIIGILATVSTATFSNTIGKARDVERTAAVKQVSQIIEGESLGVSGEQRYFFGGAGLRSVLEKHGYNMPAAKNDICYYIFAALNDGFASSLSDVISNQGASALRTGGENNEFLMVTWGEASSTVNSSNAGPIFQGSPGGIQVATNNAGNLSRDDFACPEPGNQPDLWTKTNHIKEQLLGSGEGFDGRQVIIIVGEAAKPEDPEEVIQETQLNNFLSLS